MRLNLDSSFLNAASIYLIYIIVLRILIQKGIGAGAEDEVLLQQRQRPVPYAAPPTEKPVRKQFRIFNLFRFYEFTEGRSV